MKRSIKRWLHVSRILVAIQVSGGMDTLPHNGAVITLLAVTGLTHKQNPIKIFLPLRSLKLALYV
jgi:H+/gluconate symporter-like permease